MWDQETREVTAVKSCCCSSREPGFGSRGLYWVVHNCLYYQGIRLLVLASGAVGPACMWCTYIHSSAHIHNFSKLDMGPDTKNSFRKQATRY